MVSLDVQITTLQYRLKDSTSAKHLNRMAGSVSYVWNYCNEVNQEQWKKFCKTYSGFDLNKKTSGVAKELGLHSQTVQAIGAEFATRCKQFKKVKLNWRSHKRSLGWIPFKASGVKVVDDTIQYQGKVFRFWLSRPIEGKVKTGSFSQDARGRWYVNLTIQEADRSREKTSKACGIDLGLKTIATLSDGTELNRENLTKKYEENLAVAQRAGKKKQVATIHAKIKNRRKDWNHKKTTKLVRAYDYIAVGNVSSSKLKKTRMAKSVSDAGWSQFKTMLEYKAITLGVEVKEVSESFSTVTCSSCEQRTGPKGLSGLKVREWICSRCGTVHDRDVNAATNILFSAQGIARRRESHRAPGAVFRRERMSSINS